MVERLIVRILIAVAFCAGLLAIVTVPLPVDAKGNPDLPALALGQAGLYRLEIALMVFYGDLLLVTPAFLGLVRGRLPIEISTRGAKFAEETDQSTARDEVAIEKLEQRVSDLATELKASAAEIKQLKKAAGDRT